MKGSRRSQLDEPAVEFPTPARLVGALTSPEFLFSHLQSLNDDLRISRVRNKLHSEVCKLSGIQ